MVGIPRLNLRSLSTHVVRDGLVQKIPPGPNSPIYSIST